MDFANAMKIIASGMSAQRLRVNLLSSNLANAHTTRSADGGPYRRRDAIFQAQLPIDSFEEILSEIEQDNLRGVKVNRVAASPRFREVYDPHHPDCNSEGYVNLPDINVIEEMVDLLQATRTYQANVQAARALKSMAQQALNIG